MHLKSLFSKVIGTAQSVCGQNLSKATKSVPFVLKRIIPLFLNPPESSANPPGTWALINSGLFKSVTKFTLATERIQFSKLLVSEHFLDVF